MAKNYIQDGDVIEFLNGSVAKKSGDVVVIGSNGDALLGIALNDVAANAVGNAGIEDVWQCPKVSGAVIAQGEYVMWDSSANAFDDNLATPATGDVTDGAIAWESKGVGATTIIVKLIGKPGILT